MEPTTVEQQIEFLIEKIRLEGKKSKDLILAKATSAVKLDKYIAVFTVKLRDEGVPVTLIKGMLGDEEVYQGALLDKIVGEESLKAHWERLKYLQAQLNGYQSINRFLEKTQS